MPWTPEDAKKKYTSLSDHQAKVWSSVANAALKKCMEAGEEDCDASAIRQANAAVNKMQKSEALGESAQILVEIGRAISSSNAKTIQNAIRAMRDAISAISPLVADDAEEEVNEALRIDQQLDPVSLLRPTGRQKWQLARLDEAAKILAQNDSYDNIRYAVQSALRKKAMQDYMKTKVSSGSVDSEYYYDYPHPYIQAMYDGYAVYSLGGKLYQCEYSVKDSEVTVGDSIEVQVSYVPISDENKNQEHKPIEVKGDLIQLVEKAVKPDGTARICLISPGWGSSGYYSAEMLRRDGPKVFQKGTHMYMNHPTEEEANSRPERDIRDLAGVIESDVAWEEATSKNVGPGLYADVKLFPTYREFIDEAAEHIGVSIRAAGTAVDGQAENRKGLIIDSLKEGYSVDYVTMAGRGGTVLPLYESARNRIVKVSEENGSIQIETTEIKEVYTVDITQEELNSLRESASKASDLEKRLAESQSLIGKLQERMVLAEAHSVVASAISGLELPDITKARLIKESLRTLPMNEDNTLNSDKLTERVNELVASEKQYIETVLGNVTGGKVVGMNPTIDPTKELTEADVDKDLEDAWGLFGLDERASKIATKGRN